MKITDVKVHILKPTFSYSGGKSMPPREIKYTLLRIFTDGGIEGDYMIWSGFPTAFPNIVADLIVRAFKPQLIGEDPFYREKIWQKIGGTSWSVHGAGPALGAIDIALWDIVGKAAHMPIYKLLGAFRDKVKAYASNIRMEKMEDFLNEASKLKKKGYSAYKLHTSGIPIDDLKICKAIRESVGDEMILMHDAAFAYDNLEALKVGRELEKLNYHWFEAPLPHDDISGYVELTKALEIPIALEVLYNYAEYVRRGAIDIFRSVADFTGGITEMIKTASLCYLSNLKWEPHSFGSTLCQAANLQVILSVKNCDFFELPVYQGKEGIFDVAMKDNIRIDEKGYVHGSKKPGLGLEIDWNQVEELTLKVL
ncbi:MAG: mandelate racemase [Candidatus Bathyarchaeota archaeon]|nr:MAG: mandelate racemase [Candidatus Bathyarchaeota archaeon]